jgi:hypothetical protein
MNKIVPDSYRDQLAYDSKLICRYTSRLFATGSDFDGISQR